MKSWMVANKYISDKFGSGVMIIPRQKGSINTHINQPTSIFVPSSFGWTTSFIPWITVAIVCSRVNQPTKLKKSIHPMRIHIYCIYLHLVDFYIFSCYIHLHLVDLCGKSRKIYHTWILWAWIVITSSLLTDQPPRLFFRCCGVQKFPGVWSLEQIRSLLFF